MNKKEQKPTKKWIEDQIGYHKTQIIMNQGSINLLEAMLKNNIFIEEENIPNNSEKE